MELHARLVHAEPGLRVVEVRATQGERSLGSALGEGGTAQEAEDLALARLSRRLERAAAPGAVPADAEASASPSLAGRAQVPPPVRSLSATRPNRQDLRAGGSGRPAPGPAAAALAPTDANPVAVAPEEGPLAAVPADEATPPLRSADPDEAAPAGAALPADVAAAQPQLSRSPASQPSVPAEDGLEEPPVDPEDWSAELAALDLQLRRLGWDRDHEGTYLQRAFGHPSRSRLTRYSDLRAYLQAVEGLERGSDPAVAAIPLRRSELLAQGDSLLRQLGWSPEQGRAFLERELQRVSRQQLSDSQLLQFNMLLEGELLAADPSIPAGQRGAEADREDQR